MKKVESKIEIKSSAENILGPMSLKVEVKEKRDWTELYLCQDGYREGNDWNWYYEAVKQAWPVVLQNLKKFLEKN